MNNLWDELIKIGFTELKYPTKSIDRLSEKYKLVNFFHKTQYSKSTDTLEQLGLIVYFDHWHVDVFYDGDAWTKGSISINSKYITFKNRDYSVEEIFNYINGEIIRIKRELKLIRITKKKLSINF